jgi:hypothetical protein
LLLSVLGCTGRAEIYAVTLATRKINPAEPLMLRFDPSACCYWLNERNQLCLALKERDASLLGRYFKGETLMSFELGEPPAGSARDYPVGPRTFRAYRKAGLGHFRYASLNGGVAVTEYKEGRLKGRFRLTAKQQSYSVLTGWTGDARLLFFGDFVATHDPEAGRGILERTEEGGLQRQAPMTARPK